MVVIFCYFQEENYKILKLHVNNSSFSEISASLHGLLNTRPYFLHFRGQF